MSNNTATNWANWAVHYTERITISNTGCKSHVVAYYINAYYGGNNGFASAVVAFPTNSGLSYRFKRVGIGTWHETNTFLKVWEVEIPAHSSVTVPTEVLLGGNSAGTLGRKVVLIS